MTYWKQLQQSFREQRPPSLPGNIDKVELFNKYFSDISTVPGKHKRISKSITKT